MHCCAHAGVEDVVDGSEDFGAEDRGGGLAAWDLELQGTVLDDYVSGSVELCVGCGGDGIGAHAQRAREGGGCGKVDG